MLRSHFRSFAVVLLLLLGLGLLGTSCQNRADDCTETLTCPSSGGSEASGGTDGTGGTGEGGDGGLGGQGGDGIGGMGGTTIEPCDPTVDECTGGFIVHVSPLGDDDGDGSALEPLKTLGAALGRVELAVEGGEKEPLIYVCATEGPYEETLSLGPEHGALGIFGGFECEQFVSTTADRATFVAEAASGHRIEGAAQVTLGDLRLESPDAEGDGASSRALTVVESTGVRLLRSELVAGKGAAGASGEGYAVDDPADAGAVGNVGNDACAATPDETNYGGPPAITSCNDSATASIGGRGGPGGGGLQASEEGYPGGAGKPDGGTPGTGEIGSACVAGGVGDPGAIGVHGVPSGNLGTVDQDGYTPPVGGSGEAGGLGEGGGGGGGAKKPGSCATGASGGSGGGGGCPGAGATGGQGGGGSFGLVSIDSALELLEVSIVVAPGGDGGVGGSGQSGGESGSGADGGTKGAAGDATPACDGGDGGPGGNGGSGAGGAGGPAIGMAFSGPEPTGLDDVQVELPAAAAGGEGGLLNQLAGKGEPGVVAKSLSF